jgi:hypothetical protein
MISKTELSLVWTIKCVHEVEGARQTRNAGGFIMLVLLYKFRNCGAWIIHPLKNDGLLNSLPFVPQHWEKNCVKATLECVLCNTITTLNWTQLKSVLN